MKFNLKNRPTNISPDYHADCRRLFQKYEEWFKGFTKQLEDEKQELESHLGHLEQGWHEGYNLIIKILGYTP